MTQGVPYVGDLLLANHATLPFAVTIIVPRNFVLTRVEVCQPRGTLAGFNVQLSLPHPDELIGYQNNGETLIEAEAALAALLTTITVAGAASKGAYDCNIPVQARDSDGISQEQATLKALFTVTTPGAGKLFGVRVFGVIVTD
jgi:hypothetical protein